MYTLKKIIKNKSGSTQQVLNRDVPNDGEYDIPSHLWMELETCLEIKNAVTSGDFVVNDGIEDLASDKGLLHIKRMQPLDFYSSFAVDKNGQDQTLSTSWQEVTAQRTIWDLNSDYDAQTNIFTIPRDGIYVVEIQLKLKSLVDVSNIELALFKKIEGQPDEHWFILDYKDALNAETQLTASVYFDFYRGEQYTIKIKMTGGLLVSGKVDGDDCYTAWGINFEKPLFISS